MERLSSEIVRVWEGESVERTYGRVRVCPALTAGARVVTRADGSQETILGQGARVPGEDYQAR